MQKWSKFLFIFMVGVLALTLGFVVNLKNSSSPPQTPPVSAQPTIQPTSIFSEITNDGLASYLKITLADQPSNIKSIKVIQTIGTVSYTLTTDELNNPCYYLNDPSASKHTTYYFTRPATYSVQYILTNNTVLSESINFEPKINKQILKTLHTVNETSQNAIVETNNNFYFTKAGILSIPLNDNLFTVSASYKYYDEYQTEQTNSKISLVSSIPDNSYGTVTYTITNKQNNTSISQDIVVLTTDFDVDFKDVNGDAINKINHYLLNGYVFNEGINLSISIKNNAVSLNNEPLIEKEKTDIFKLFDFSINENTRNSTNTANEKFSETTLTHNENQSYLTHTIDVVDHSIFQVKTIFKDAISLNNEYENNIPKIKIVTKVPTNSEEDYIFSIILGQVGNYKTNNYLDGVLNGYLNANTVIYYPTSATRLYYNGNSGTVSKLNYTINSNTRSINKNESIDFTTNNEIITISNNTQLFDEFITYSFKIKTYATANFIEHMLNNRMYYNGSSVITDDFSDYENSINNAINSFKYIVPSNYSTDCIPTYMRVTYNGTSFDNIYNLNDNDVIEFTEYGEYTVEFYNLPNYNFLITNLSNLANTYYYYKLNFTIAGPSIFATSTDINGKPLTMSNNLYTQNEVNLSVDIDDGQKIIVYLNGELYGSTTQNLSNYKLTSVGTWKISIVDAMQNELKTLSFTIADKVYQGFSINNKEDYFNLIVYSQVSKLPVVFEELEEDNAYHLTQTGTYKIDIDAIEQFKFTVNGTATYDYTLNSNTIVFDVLKSYFALQYAQGKNGSRISQSVVVSAVAGVQLQSLEVYKNGKLIKTFTADQLADWETITEGSRSFSDNGTYTFKLTDKFGNTYESQIEKYYKVNVALILLILVILAGIIILFVSIIKSRRRIKVK